ncbi:MAG: hypothetical protein GY729_17120 [Desulfobacteraceae bacterium]|nr:hypothetical protein [Desulfobacteraceae bacterium]
MPPARRRLDTVKLILDNSRYEIKTNAINKIRVITEKDADIFTLGNPVPKKLKGISIGTPLLELKRRFPNAKVTDTWFDFERDYWTYFFVTAIFLHDKNPEDPKIEQMFFWIRKDLRNKFIDKMIEILGEPDSRVYVDAEIVWNNVNGVKVKVNNDNYIISKAENKN